MRDYLEVRTVSAPAEKRSFKGHVPNQSILMRHLYITNPRSSWWSLPAFDVSNHRDPLAFEDARSPMIERPCHYTMALSIKVNSRGTIVTNHSILYKIDRIILYFLTQVPAFSYQWFVAEKRNPWMNMPHWKELWDSKHESDKLRIRTEWEMIH